MNSLLRKLLSDRKYKALARVKNKTLPNARYRLGQSPFLIIGSVFKLLPDNSKVTLKSGINVVKKLDYERSDIFLNIDSDLEYRVRLNSCKKEPETIEWIETFFQEGDVLFDIGANIGAYSLVTAKFFGHKVKVYAFEPAFLNFPQLCKNLTLNGCQESVIPFQVALSDETGIENFNYFNLIPGGAVHTLGETIDFLGDEFTPATVQPVLRYRVDDFIKQFGIPVPNHIKIDVDGTEFSILKGMAETLANGSVRSILLEITPGRSQGDNIVEYLEEKGFKAHSKAGLNHIFIRGA